MTDGDGCEGGRVILPRTTPAVGLDPSARDESIVEARIAHVMTPFVRMLILRLAEGHVDVSLDQNVAMGPRHLGTAVATPAR